MSVDPRPPESASAPFVPPEAEIVSISPARAREILRASRADVWALVGCNVIVFASSVCIMVLELAASRLIAAHLGQSLYSWTSVIGVVLAGISLGNFLGGWLADRFLPEKVLPWLFVAAGLLTLNVLVVNYWAGGTERADWISWPIWVMFVVAWIFLFPSIALGTISPVTASIALKRTQRTGITVGNIYAWGALGSIVGTFLAGFLLIDLMGTRAIVVLTAGALLTMAVVVAAGQQALRSGVLFGGLPLVLVVGLCAAATSEKTAYAVTALRTAGGFSSPQKQAEALANWQRWGLQLGKNLHELGLTLRLRQDSTTDYTDESNYSEISVAPYRDPDTGEQYQALVLDALHHSYFDPDDPTRLHYDYEQVYAAITERACNMWDRKSSVTIRQEPDPGFAQMLPKSCRYEPATRTLEAHGGLGMLRDLKDLVDIGPDSEYRVALIQAFLDSRARQGEQSRTKLARLPPGVQIPFDMASRIRYDAFLNELQCEKPLSFDDLFRLMAVGEQQPYVEDVTALFKKSRRVRTLFVGGGGFIFPRWTEAFFPENPRIDVAEIDPAVLTAVQRSMGLPSDPARTKVRGHIGDARNIVDDLLRGNARRKASGEPLVQYDFVYGDAFNHYSVPWHLTTREFDEKIHALLDPQEGVYLVNIIDVFARAEYPPRDEKAGRGSAVCMGPLPEALMPRDLKQGGDWAACPPPYEYLQVRWKDADLHELFLERILSHNQREALYALTEDKDGEVLEELEPFRDALQVLKSVTEDRRLYEGPLPAPLTAEGLKFGTWIAAPRPYQDLEIQDFGTNKCLLGFRGRMSAEERDALKALLPSDAHWSAAIDGLARDAESVRSGKFLGRYVNTARQVFPFVAVFSSTRDGTSEDRDTFVVACSMRNLEFTNLHEAAGYWPNPPFAWTERSADGQFHDHGQMTALLDRAEGLLLTDDYAPVDNLLTPLFDERE